MTFPIHPKPQEGESVTSWLVRLAESNTISIQALLSLYQENMRWDRRDLDFLDVEKFQPLFTAARISIDKSSVPKTLLHIEQVCFADGPADINFFISSTQITRYCPLCIANDMQPYLRLSWRFLLLPICSRHKVLLQTECWNTKCRHKQRLSKFSLNAKCTKCGTKLDGATITSLKNWDNLFAFEEMMEQFIKENSVKSSNFPYGIQEFFMILSLLIRYFNRYLPKEASWDKLKEIHGLDISQPYDWKKNASFACIVLEQALSIAKEWSLAEDFIRRNKLRFKSLCSESGWKIPEIIKPFILGDSSNEKSKLVLKDFRNYGSLSHEEKVQKAADFLFANNSIPSFKRISKMAGISYVSIYKDPDLYNIIMVAKERFRAKQEREIADAVKVLRSRNAPISIASVATYLGRSDKYITRQHFDAFKSFLRMA